MSPFQGQLRRIVHNIFQTSSRHIRPPHFASKVSYSASPQSLAAKKFVNSFNSLLRRLRPIIKFVVVLRPFPRPQEIRLIRCSAVRGQPKIRCNAAPKIYFVVPPQSIFTTFRNSPPHFLKNPITPRPTAFSLSFILTAKRKKLFPKHLI